MSPVGLCRLHFKGGVAISEAAALDIVQLSPGTAVQVGRRAALRGLQPALRTRLDAGDQQPAGSGMDGSPRLGAADPRAAGSTHPPGPHPGDERRKLPPETEQTQARLNAERLILPTTFHQTLRGEHGSFRYAPVFVMGGVKLDHTFLPPHRQRLAAVSVRFCDWFYFGLKIVRNTDSSPT